MKRNTPPLFHSIAILALLFLLAGAIVAIGKSRPKEITPKRLYKEMINSGKAESSGSNAIDSFLQMKSSN